MPVGPKGDGVAGRRFLMRWVGIVALASALAGGLARYEVLYSLENVYFDYWHVIAKKRYEPKHAAFVTVDDATLVALKDDPLAFWAPYWAQVFDTLDKVGVKAAGLDFLYTVSAESWLKKLNLPENEISRNYDSPFRAALAQGNKILITQLIELPGGDLGLVTPPDDQRLLLPAGNNDLGIANLNPDPDKHVRRFFPVMIPDPQLPGIAFNMQLALRGAGADPTASEWTIAGRRITREPRRLPIGYTGPAGTIPTVSMLTLLQPDALSKPEVQALKGRVVVIAANNAGTSDRHFTPYSRGVDSDQMAGGEIHANIIETIMSGRYPTPLSFAGGIAYLVFVVGCAVYFFLRLAPGWGALVAFAACVIVGPPAYFAFAHDLVLPVAELQVGTVSAFLMTLGLRLTGEERERSRMRQVFGRYVSDEVVNVLLSEGHRPDLAGAALDVTVLFSDIRGFTTISEKLTAHEVVEMLNAYFTAACEPILEQGGTVDKYIGDAVMAVFGSPVQYPDHARRAVKAAVGMAAAAVEFRQWMLSRFPDRGLPEFGIGVGLHTGEAVIGDIGTPKRKEFTAIGDTVNAASRLEGVTKELHCVIAASESTVKAAGPGVKTGKVEELTVKGRAEPIRVFEVTGLEGG